nr:NADH dehydrogenase subunit 6 [Acromitus sp. 1 MKL-2023]
MISPVFMILTLISAIMVITSIHPVHSIIWLVLSFIGSATLFIQLQADFIALATLIIYVGAIAILFIFALMMLNLSSTDTDYSVTAVLPLIVLIAITTTSLVINLNFCSDLSPDDSVYLIKHFTNLQTISTELYVSHAEQLITASIVLLVGMIGAIVLTLNLESTVKRQNLFTQVSRDSFHNPKNPTNNFN